jgi:hypothetical protein
LNIERERATVRVACSSDEIGRSSTVVGVSVPVGLPSFLSRLSDVHGLIRRINAADVRLSGRRWMFAELHAAAIEAHWRMRAVQQPDLFNGRVLMLCEGMTAAGVFRGTCLVTDYKSFLYWHENDGPDRTVRNLFAVAALHTREPWLLLARMSPRHSNPGLIYPPCGLLDPEDDVVDGLVDLDGNMLREVRERPGSTSPDPTSVRRSSFKTGRGSSMYDK